MFELITQTFNASVMAVTQIFLSTVVTTNPWFESLELQYEVNRQEIVCSTKLDSAFTASLDDLLLSGQNITIHFRFELFPAGESSPVQRKEIVNGFRFDEEADIYYLFNSEDPKPERFFTAEAAKDTYVSVQNLTVAVTDDLSPDQEYFIRVTASLDPVKLKDMSASVNLMLRWTSVKPTIVSDKFRIKPRAT